MQSNSNATPNPIAKRFKFSTKNCIHDESLAEYLAALNKLSEYSSYNATQTNMLRDRLACGVMHERMQHRLLSQGEGLKLDKVTNIALSMEPAIAQVSEIQTYQYQQQSTSDIALNYVTYKHAKPLEQVNCFRC